jgi:hypothetical protein
MPTFDDRGLPTGSTHEAARHAVESALWRMMAFYDTPIADLDAASVFDPAWPLPHAMKAGFPTSARAGGQEHAVARARSCRGAATR